MKNIRIITLALLLLILPSILRFFWFYQGFPPQKNDVDSPDFTSYEFPQPELSTPAPISPKEAEFTNSYVLIDYKHGNNFQISEIEPLTDTLKNLGTNLIIDINEESLEEYFKYVDAYIVIAPTYTFTEAEQNSIHRFITRGGRLLVICDPTRTFNDYSGYIEENTTSLISTDIANQLLAAYDISFMNDYLYNMLQNEGNFRNVIFDSPEKSSLTNDVSKVVLYGTHSIKSDQQIILTGNKNTYSSLSDQNQEPVAAVTTSDQNIFAIGDIGFLSRPYNQVNDNNQFINNIAKNLIAGNRERDLTDYPYIFQQPVTFIVEEDTIIDQKILTAVNQSQQLLAEMNIPLSMSQTVPENHDQIILGTYALYEDFATYLEPFGITFSFEDDLDFNEIDDQSGGGVPDIEISPTEDAATEMDTSNVDSEIIEITPESSEASVEINDNIPNVVQIEGIGKFSTSGIGIMLYVPSEESNSLIVLAKSSESLQEFSDTILSPYNDLSNCLTEKNMAICQLSDLEFLEDYNYSDSGEYE